MPRDRVPALLLDPVVFVRGGFRSEEDRPRESQRFLASATRGSAPHALYGIPHDDEEAGPLFRAVACEGTPHTVVDFLPSRLSEPHDEKAVVRILPAQRKTLVGRDEEAGLSLGFVPKPRIRQTLQMDTADVPHVVAQGRQGGRGHARDVLVDQDFHGSPAALAERGNLFLGEGCRVVETSPDILGREGREVED